MPVSTDRTACVSSARSHRRSPALRSPRDDPMESPQPFPAARPALAVALLLGACGGGPEQERAPNLLLISIDTLRADFLACYGHERVTAPELDALAERGTLFEDVTAASPWTLPSHASMLTGLYPSTHGVKDHGFQLTAPTLATHLETLGYQTVAVVNSHNLGETKYGLLRGFERSHWVMEMEIVDGKLGKDVLNYGRDVNAKALTFLDELDPARPFFCFLHYYDVHTDFTPDERWVAEYVEPYDGRLSGLTQDLVRARNHMQEVERDDLRYLEQLYEAEIRTFDGVLAELLASLGERGLLANTVLCVTSDHGEEYGEHGGLLHGRTHYQEVLRIPLLLSGPGVPVGLRVPEPAHLVDVAPTLLALLGAPLPGPVDGLDLSAHWRAPGTLPTVRTLFSEADHHNLVDGVTVDGIRSMVRVGDDKLHYDRSTGRRELYHLGRDPGETVERSLLDGERAGELWDELEAFLQGAVEGTPVEPMTEQDIELLKRLGYLGDGSE